MSSRDEPHARRNGEEPRADAVAERRCPTCGALVAVDADWCGQCFASLEGASTLPTGPPPGPEPPVEVGADRGDDSARAAASVPHWTCPSCGEENDLDADPCPSCGTPFARLFREPRSTPDVARGRAIAWSLAYPGLGHRLAGRAGEGFARGAVFTLALGGILFLVVSRAGHSLGPILTFLFVYALFGIAVYAFTAVEAGHLADGGDPLVSGRAFAWVAAGLVLVSLAVSVFIAVGAIRGG